MTSRDRRALAWGGAAVLGAVLTLRVAPAAAHSVVELRTTVAEERALVARTRTVLQGRDAVQDSLAQALSAIVALAPKLVEGRSRAEAEHALTSLVSLAAGRQGLKVVRLDGRKPADSTAGVFSQVAVHAELEGDIAGLARLLRAFETGDPLLSVSSLRVSPTEPAARSNSSEVLRAELSLSGYYLPRNPR